MQIAIFTDTFLPQLNGVVTHIVETSKFLRDRGHTVLIVAPKAGKKKKEHLYENVDILYIPSIPFRFYEGLRFASPFSISVMEEMNEFQPDIIHFHTPGSIGIMGIMIAKMLKIPLVGTFHTFFMEPEYLRNLGLHKVKLDKNQVVNKLIWQYLNIFYNRADAVITPTNYTKKDLILNGLNVPVNVISNGIDLKDISDKTVPQTTYKLPLKYFLYVGRISEEKSLDKVIQAFSNITSKDSEFSLVIVGDGPKKNIIKKLVRNLELQKKVIFLGSISHEKLIHSNIYKDASGFITASKSETQCISLLEAAAFGIPLIGVKARGVPDLIQKNGLLCAPDDVVCLSKSLLLLINDKEKRVQLSKNSLQLATQHSIEETVDALEKVYLSLVGSYSGGNNEEYRANNF